jgi:hypothetical protein
MKWNMIYSDKLITTKKLQKTTDVIFSYFSGKSK